SFINLTMLGVTVHSFRFWFAAFCLAAAFVTPAVAAPAKMSTVPFLGEKPKDPALRTKLTRDIRQFRAGEQVALQEITLFCELDRQNLGRRSLYDAWNKRCKNREAIWNTKYRQKGEGRMIDMQMRLYAERRLAMAKFSSGYFTEKEAIGKKVRRRGDVARHVKEALRQKKMLIQVSLQNLRFFFALRDLIDAAQK
ncbi:MAG: hypothetical protein ACI82H_001178, partial [Alphaproteobacteria bacterium]